jgi:electron transport complex protein RnfA
MDGMISLVVFSSFACNVILQCALGVQGIAEGQERSDPIPRVQGGILFLSVLILWVIFSYLLSPLAFGFLEYILFFPLSALVCMGLETLGDRFFPLASSSKLFTAHSAYNGLALISLILTLHIATNFLDALILSLSFSLSSLAVIFLLNEIRKRSALEMVPPFLRGRPIMLISMGLLSLIFTSLTVILFNILGVF